MLLNLLNKRFHFVVSQLYHPTWSEGFRADDSSKDEQWAFMSQFKLDSRRIIVFQIYKIEIRDLKKNIN